MSKCTVYCWSVLAIMRYPFISFFLCLVLSFSSQAQLITTGNSAGTISGTGLQIPGAGTLTGPTGGYNTFMAFSARGGLKLPGFESINGSPYLHPEYNNGYVRILSGYTQAAVPVKFNLYGNEIIFTSKENELALDSVDYVTYSAIGNNGKLETIKLKSGFPPIGNNTSQTIYQLLDSGSRVQLLKYYYQKVEETKSMGTAPMKEFITYQDLYVNSTNGIKKIKIDLKSVKDALPEYVKEIESIVADKKLKLKKESDLVLLINELNQAKAF